MSAVNGRGQSSGGGLVRKEYSAFAYPMRRKEGHWSVRRVLY